MINDDCDDDDNDGDDGDDGGGDGGTEKKEDRRSILTHPNSRSPAPAVRILLVP